MWYNIPEDEVIDFSWRAAGTFVSNIRNSIMSGINENYMDYYCSGSEGEVDPQIEDWLSKFDIILFENFYTEISHIVIGHHKTSVVLQYGMKMDDRIAEFKKSNPKIIAYNRSKNIDKIL